MGAFKLPIDIINRALQHMHANRISRLTEHSANALEPVAAYDRIRESELSNNLWRFATRRVILRAVQTQAVYLHTSAQTTSGTTLTFTSTMGVQIGQLVTGTNIPANTTVSAYTATTVTLSAAVSGTVASAATITFGSPTFLWTPPTYAAGTAYAVGNVVVDSTGDWWQARVSTTGNAPTPGPIWGRYYGPETAEPFLAGATNQPGTYFAGDLAMAGGTVYLSLNNANPDTPPSVNWLDVLGTTVPLSILWPIGTGPASDLGTNNVYRLPHGFLRRAPTDPKAGLTNNWLGFPGNMPSEDYTMEGDYIVSSSRGPVMIRYVADFVDVQDMDASFCEMFAARIAMETMTTPNMAIEQKQAALIMSSCRAHYKRERAGAVQQNAIEMGPTEMELEEYIRVRI